MQNFNLTPPPPPPPPCPKLDSIQELLPDPPPPPIHPQINVMLKGKDPVDKGLITIISYDLLSRCAPRLKACNFKV